MTPQDVKEILRVIKSCYGTKFKVDNDNLKQIRDTWHRYLKDFELQEVMDKVDAHILANPFPPTLTDLIPRKQPSGQTSNVPDMEETYRLLESYTQEKASENTVQENLAKMREILGQRRNRNS